MDMVSRKWLTTLCSAEETSTQVEAAFTAALDAEQLLDLVDKRTSTALRQALRSGDRDAIGTVIERRAAAPAARRLRQRPPDAVPLHPGVPRRRPHRSALRPTAHPDRPGVDRDLVRARQGRVAPPGEDHRPRRSGNAELHRASREYNTVRLHASIGYVTPDDEHEGRGEALRQARRQGLADARQAGIYYRRTTTENQP